MNEEDMRRFLDRLDRIIELLEIQVSGGGTDFKPMAESQETPPPSGEPRTLLDELKDAGVDMGLLDVSETVIKPKRFLGDIWRDANDVLKAHGWKWVSDKRNSRWVRDGGGGKPKNPNAPATKKQRDYIESLGGYVKPNLTVGEASTLIDYLLSQKKRG